MIGIFDYYLIPLAIFLNATTVQIGILVSVPSLLSALSQLFAVKVVHLAGNRKKLILSVILWQIIFLLPIPILAVVTLPRSVELLVLLVIMFRVLGSIMGPAWGSMVSDYLPENRRGKFFGYRARIIAISGIVGVGFWGAFLSFMNKISEAWGLFAVFLSAALCRMISLYYMSRMVELPHVSRREDHFTFWMFIRRFKESNFVKFILFVASLTFATQLSSAYFSVYMLKELHFGYIGYMSVHLASVLTGLLSFPVWGRHADQVGNAKVLKSTSFLIPLIPLFWIFGRDVFTLIVIEMFSGFVWGGFNLCATNFIYDAVTPSKRVRCLSYFNLITGFALFGGAFLGGYLAYRLPTIGDYSPLVTLFIISGICRFLAHFILSRHFQEVRGSYTKVRSVRLFLSVIGVHSIIGRNIEWGPFPMLRRFIMRKT